MTWHYKAYVLRRQSMWLHTWQEHFNISMSLQHRLNLSMGGVACSSGHYKGYRYCSTCPLVELLAARPWREYMSACPMEGNENIHILRRWITRYNQVTYMANMLSTSMGRCLHPWPWSEVNIAPIYAWHAILKSMPLEGKAWDYLHF